MATKASTTKTASKKVAPNAQATTALKPNGKAARIGGRFRVGSELARMYELLRDEKPRTVAEINKVTQSKKPQNIANGKFQALRSHGKTAGYEMKKLEDGKIQMVIGKSASTK